MPFKGGMPMFSHVMLGADDIDASKAFYDATLATLGVPPGRQDDKGRVFWMTRSGVFALSKPIDGQPASCGNGSTVGFAADSPEHVHAWHQAGLANGGAAIEDPPGVRSGTTGKLYLAYLRDPSGNKLCALHRLPREEDKS
jgi:catechol 2,3-dioxygenase-like lactoylglutathione lyase family enzyme